MSFADFKLIGLNRFPTSLYMWGDNTNGLLGDNRTPNYFSWSKISSGGLHTVAIRSDGLLYGWGRNTEGQLMQVSDTVHRSSPTQIGTGSWNAISTGLSHSIAIRSDNTLWAWGGNRYGQLGDGTTVNKSSWVQVGASSWSVISAGGNHTGAININGQLFTWGFNGSGQVGDSTIVFKSSPIQVGTGNSWLNVSAGKTHTIALATDYKLYTWGDNTYGELGDSTTVNRSSPVQIGTSSWSQISAGGTHTAGIESDGSLLTWGLNSSGQLGLNNAYSGSYWTQVSEGPTHTLAIRNDGALFVWGRNQLGQLGTGDTTDRSSPVQLGTSSWTSVDTGSSHSVAIRSDGKLFTWGSNDLGQLGNFPDPINYTWSKVVITASAAYTFAIRSDGTLWGWGLGTSSNLGDGTALSKSSPTQIGASLNASWIDIAVGSTHTLGITNENTLYTWGIGTSGQLGDLTIVTRNTPSIVGYNYKKVFGGVTISAALDLNNYLYMWGLNSNGALGDGSTSNKSSPMIVGADTWSSLSMDSHVLGIKTTGTLWAWGLNTSGQLGIADAISRSSPVQIGSDSNWTQISAGSTYSLGLKNDGTLWGWGLNTSGQLGLSDTTYRSSPVQIASDTSWLAVAAGSAHTLALSTSGYLYTWGAGTSGGLGDGTTITRSSPVQIGTDVYTNVQAGITFALAVKNDNALFTWGLGTTGQLGDNTLVSRSSPVQIGGYYVNYSSPVQIGASSWTQVSAGDAHTLGLGSDGILYGWGRNFEGQLGGSTNTLGIAWSKVVVGPTHTLGIRFDGKLYAWGDNSSGQLGDRTVVAKTSPILVDSVNKWKDITVGQGTQYFSMAIRTDGKLFAWGNNQGGQLGWLSWRQLSVGTGHSLLLRSDGRLYTMGTNTAGQLGDPTFGVTNRSSPVQIGTSSWSVISAGISASAAIDTRGRLFTWGLGSSGQLGLASTTNRSSPIQVSSGSWSQVAIKDYTLAISTQGSMYVWGNNNNGQLGIGTVVNATIPKLLDGTSVPSTYSIATSGVADYYTVPSNVAFNFGTGTFTIELWVYPLSTAQGSGNDPALYSQYDAATTGQGNFQIWIRTSDSKFVVQYDGGPAAGIVGNTIVTLGTWTHVAVVRTGSTVILFVNGINDGSVSFSGQMGRTDTVWLASQNGGSSLFNGYISNLRVVKGQALYTSRFTPTTSPLTTTSQGISTGTVSLLTAKSPTISDNSSNGFTITQFGTPIVSPHNPFEVLSSTSSTSWTSISAGTHSLAIRNDGTLYSWGQNNYGQLGDSTTISKSSPIQLGSRSWSLVSASMTGHSLAVDTLSVLYVWGNNTYGELGLNNEFVNVSSPTQLSTTLSFTSITAGYNSSIGTTLLNNLTTAYGWGYNNYNQLATINAYIWRSAGTGSGIQTNPSSSIGKLYVWGDNTYGQLGNNTTVTRSSPTQVGGFLGASTYKYTVNSVLNTAFINNENLLYIVGDNTYGQLGQGDTISRSSPVQVGSDTWSTIVVSGTGHVLAISGTGSLFSWGNNTYNELGQVDSVVANRSSPVTIGGNTDWTSVSVGNNFSMALNNVGAMYTWGRNDIGQLGTANPLSYTSIGAGVASRNDGKLYTWGYNNFGQLGDASLANANRSTLTQISTLAVASTSWTSVSGSYNNRAGIKIDSKLFAWGDNRYGQLGISEGPEINISRSQPVQILGSWSQIYVNIDNIFGIRSDNTLWSWGNNNVGQLGLGDLISRSSPVQIGSDTNWSMVVASGTGHVIALKTTGALFAWGNNQYNELGQNQRVQIHYSSPIQIGTSSWTKVSAGSNNSFAIRTDGSLWGWGRNDYGQIGLLNNIPLSWTNVAGGDSYSVAIRSDGKLFSWGRNDKGQLGLGHTISKSAPTQIAVSTNYNLYSTFFNGTTDYLNTTNSQYDTGAGTSDFTIEGWVNNNGFAGSQYGRGIFTFYPSAGYATTRLLIRLDLASNLFNLYLVLGGVIKFGTNGTNTSGNGTATVGLWTHFALVRQSQTFNFYINGVLNTTISGITDSFTGFDTIDIGRSQDGTVPYFNGYISNIRYVKGTAVYTTSFAVPTTPLSNISNTSLLTCQNDSYIDNSTITVKTITPAGTGISTSTLTPFVYTAQSNYSWTQVSTILSHTVAVRNDGTLWAWGDNSAGQLSQGDIANRSAPIQIGSSSWTSVFAGRNATYAIRTDGGLFIAGENTYGQLGFNDATNRSSIVQLGTNSWTTISASQTGHVLGILNTGALFAWGNNLWNELGLDQSNNTQTSPSTSAPNRSSPVQVGTSSWTKVSAGNSFSVAIRSDSTLWTWGRNDIGQLATSTVSRSWTLARVQSAIRSDGKLFTWGSNNSGEAGQNTVYGNRSAPTQITGGNSWSFVSANTYNMLAIRTDGILFAWGYNNTGQLGDGSTTNKSSPVQIGSDRWSTVVVGGAGTTSAGITTDGKLYTWGDNSSGQLGQGDLQPRSVPAQVGSSSWSQVATASGSMFGITINGALFGWGLNTSGQLGLNDTTNRSVPTIIKSGESFIQAATGANVSFLIRNDYKLFGVGSATGGQLGDGSVVSKSSPVLVGATIGTSSWTQVSVGLGAAFAIMSDGKLFSWGDNFLGQLGGSSSVAIASSVLRSNPVQVGPAGSSWISVSATSNGSSVIALTIANTLWGWGDNSGGQVGDSTIANRSAPVQITTPAVTPILPDLIKSPTQVGALATWSQIQAGTSWAAGTSTTGALFIWGGSASYELGVGTTAARSSPVQLGALLYSTLSGTINPLAIQTTTSNLYGWGIQAAGQLGLNDVALRSQPTQIASLTGLVFDNVSSPTQIGASSWTQVAAGDLYTMALRAVDGGLFTWGYGILGRLGSGATASRSSPVQVGTSSWLAISTGSTQNPVALTIAYTLFSWGLNNFGQVGDATTVDKSAPAAVGSLLNQMTDVIKTVSQLGTSTWSQISAGDSHAYAIRSDSGLFSWGQNNNGQLGQNIGLTIHRSSPVQVGATSFSQISAGYSIGAAITTLGNLQTTGLGLSGQQGSGATTTRSAFTAVGASSWTNIKALSGMMIGTTLSNLTFVWGGNSNGQLGLTDTTNRSSPVLLGSNLAASMYQTVYPSPVIVSTATTASWTQIGLGDVFGVGIENSGRLYSWGRNNTGQLGDGSTIDNTPTKSSPVQIATTASSFTFINTSSPVQINAGTSWNAVAAGGTHAVAVKSDGTLWAWGVNTYGQTGGLSTLNQYTPKQIDTQNSYTSVTAGTDFSAAITREYSLWRWGYNTTTDIASPHRSNPLQLGSLQYSKVSAAKETALAITTGGILYGWGKITTDDNFSFNLSADPITWGVGYSYSDVNAGDSFIHAVQIDNSLWAYGKNDVGQLGVNDVATRSSPVQIGSGFNWSLLGGGQGPALQAGSLYITGNNANGQLGLSDSANRSSPTQVSANNQSMLPYPVRLNNTKWNYISAGYSHSLAIGSDYVLYAWGSGSSGQLGDNTATVRSSPVVVTLPAGTSSWLTVSAGKDFTVGIRIDNTLWSWGINTRGQLGLSDTTQRNSPVQVGTGYWNDVKAGESHAVGLADNNTLFIWGDDNFGQ